jgi:hypothetical protein
LFQIPTPSRCNLRNRIPRFPLMSRIYQSCARCRLAPSYSTAQFDVSQGRKHMTTMKHPLLALSLAAWCLGSVAYAQAPGETGVAQPTTAAPTVVLPASSPATPAPEVVQSPNAASAGAGVTQIVYTPQLPTAAEITNAAAAQGLTVERLVQTSNQVIAFYRTGSGQAMNVAYQSLPPAGSAVATPTPAPAVVVTSPPPTVVAAPPRTVVYEPAPRVIYYDYPSYYYPRVWYPPVSFNVGFGYHRFHHGGGFHHHSRHRR